VNRINTSKQRASFEANSKLLPKKLPGGNVDMTKMDAKMKGVVRAAAETYDTILHNAACGDKVAVEKILESPTSYIHNIIAKGGYVQLLDEVLRNHKELIRSCDPRSLFENAVYGGSLPCVHYLAQYGAYTPSTNKDEAVSIAQKYRYADVEDLLESFYIRHKNTKRFVVPEDSDDRYVKLVLSKVDPEIDFKDMKYLFRFEGDQLKRGCSFIPFMAGKNQM